MTSYSPMNITSRPTPGSMATGPAARPILARDADAIYWMARYLERAEHIARSVQTKLNLLADSGDLNPDLQRSLWESVAQTQRAAVPEVAGDPAMPMARWMALDPANPASVLGCITRARENARGIREHISAEMWEATNAIYWSVRADDASARFEESPDTFLRSITSASALLQGLTDQTIMHDQRWQFSQLGRLIERADFTCRTVACHWHILTGPLAEDLDLPLRNIHWMGLLRCCCSIEAYRKIASGDLEPLRVVSFLLLQEGFPRTVRYCVAGANQALEAITAQTSSRTAHDALRTLGQLDAHLRYSRYDALNDDVEGFINHIEHEVAAATGNLQRSYSLS